jgi:hypothetical protein
LHLNEGVFPLPNDRVDSEVIDLAVGMLATECPQILGVLRDLIERGTIGVE